MKRPLTTRERSSRRGVLFFLVLALLAVSGGVVLGVQAAVQPEPRTVTLRAHGMSFYLPGDSKPNPRLVVARGEELRFLLQNEDRGIPHDLALPGRDGGMKSTRVVRAAGESAGLTLRAPQRAGEYEYHCTLHSRMMRGVLEVR